MKNLKSSFDAFLLHGLSETYRHTNRFPVVLQNVKRILLLSISTNLNLEFLFFLFSSFSSLFLFFTIFRNDSLTSQAKVT